MRVIPSPAQAALSAGEAREGTALEILPASGPFRVWSGQGPITVDGNAYTGICHPDLGRNSPSATGSSASGLTLTLSDVDPDVVPLVLAQPLRDAPVTIWRLIFDRTGTQLLGAFVGLRGRAGPIHVERIQPEPQTGKPGSASLVLPIEGAVAGLGRRGGRMRSDADQRLIDPNDGAFKYCAMAGTMELAWGGKPPQRAANALPGITGPTPGGGGLGGGGLMGGGGDFNIGIS